MFATFGVWQRVNTTPLPYLKVSLEGLLSQQKNILDNQLNNLMIDHNGQAESITPDEIIGAFEIATIHNGHPSYFLCV